MPNTLTPHIHAAIVAIGDELTLGERLDTNTRWLASELVRRGMTVSLHLTAPDDRAKITNAFTHACAHADIVISTGGLGPTDDDVTRQSLADASDDELVTDADALEILERRFKDRGKMLVAKNAVQAMRPSRAACLPNPLGTAPGISLRINETDVFALPGPPREMMPMFESSVVPALRVPEGRTVIARSFLTAGIGESNVATELGDLMARDRNPNISTTASPGTVTCRLRHEGEETPDSVRALDELESKFRAALGAFIIASGDVTIEQHTVALLAEKHAILVTAESCTGGLISELVTSVSGSSAVYLGGCIAYHNETKISQLSVSRDTLDAHGAVSEQTALEMSQGLLTRYAIDDVNNLCAISVTGIAGPTGGTEDKPVGTVYICCAHKNDGQVREDVRRFRFPGSREDVRQRTAAAAFTMLHFMLTDQESPELLWQVLAN